jgi:uncharacterized membrane protein
MPPRPTRPSPRGARAQASRAEVRGRPPAAALAGVVPWRQPSALEVLATGAVVALVMLVLDLTWLGLVAVDLYDRELGPLKRPDIVLPAAVAFYLMYVVATVRHAVVDANDLVDAGRRGAGLGIVAYGTYELTNWAVIAGWPVSLVPIDLLWGIALTTIVSVAGRATYDWFGRRGGR